MNQINSTYKQLMFWSPLNDNIIVTEKIAIRVGTQFAVLQPEITYSDFGKHRGGRRVVKVIFASCADSRSPRK
jgi:hypothetical protein